MYATLQYRAEKSRRQEIEHELGQVLGGRARRRLLRSRTAVIAIRDLDDFDALDDALDALAKTYAGDFDYVLFGHARGSVMRTSNGAFEASERAHMRDIVHGHG